MNEEKNTNLPKQEESQKELTTKKEWHKPEINYLDISENTQMDLAGNDDGGLYS